MLTRRSKSTFAKFILIVTVMFMLLPQMSAQATALSYVQGQVTDSSNQPLAGIRVEAIHSTTSALIATIYTGMDGTYSFPSLTDGTFKLTFIDANGFYQDKEVWATPSASANVKLDGALTVQSFIDNSYEAGVITGIVQWNYYGSGSVTYNVYYLTNTNSIIGAPIAVTGTVYSLSDVPAIAKKLGVQVVSPNAALGPIVSIPLWDQGAYMPDRFEIFDTNYNPDERNLYITWKKPVDESSFDKYVFTFKGSENQTIGSVQEVAVTGQSNYDLSNISVSNAVYRIDVTEVSNADGAAPNIYTITIPDRTTNKTNLYPAENPSLSAPTNGNFYDTDTFIQSIGGSIHWQNPSSDNGIVGYELFLLDSTSAKLSSLLTIHRSTTNYNSAYIPNSTSLNHNGTKINKIGIYPMDANGAEGPPLIVNVIDNSAGYPQSIFFFDTDPILGHITGDLTWWSASTETNLTGYQVYFTDEQNNRIGDAIHQQTKASSFQQYTYHINSDIPNTATRITVYSVNGSMMDKSASTPIWENFQIANGGATFTDSNGFANAIDGTLTWIKSDNEARINNYVIYYRDSSFEEHDLGTKAKDGSATYSFTLANSVMSNIPSYVNQIVLGTKNSRGEYSPFNQTIIISDNQLNETTTPASSINTLPAVTNLSFADMDYDANETGGYLSFKDDTTNSKDYMVYFVDAQGMKIKPIALIKGSTLGYPYYWLNLPNNTPIPSNAVAFGVFARNSSGEESTHYALAPIWDYPYTKMITGTSFIDTNDNEHAITAKLSWDRFEDESLISKYVIYYYNSLNQREILTKVNKTENTPHYNYTLSNTEFAAIPAYVTALFLEVESTNSTIVQLYAYSNEITDRTGNKVLPSQPSDVDSSLGVVTNVRVTYNAQSPITHIEWNHPGNSSNIAGFELYYINAHGQKIKSIAAIKKTSWGESEVYIPSEPLVAGASGIAIYAKNTSGVESLNYAVVLLQTNLKAALDPLNQGIGIDKILQLLSTGGSFRREDIEFALDLISPVSTTSNIPVDIIILG